MRRPGARRGPAAQHAVDDVGHLRPVLGPEPAPGAGQAAGRGGVLGEGVRRAQCAHPGVHGDLPGCVDGEAHHARPLRAVQVGAGTGGAEHGDGAHAGGGQALDDPDEGGSDR